jgi:hypothetical protein
MAKHAFPARQGEPKAVYGFTDAAGESRELRADSEGVIRPKDREDERVLESFGLDVIESEREDATRSGRRTAKPTSVLKVAGTQPGDDAGETTEG